GCVEQINMQLLKNTGKMNMNNTYQMHSLNPKRSLIRLQKAKFILSQIIFHKFQEIQLLQYVFLTRDKKSYS
ncbi:MAG TPA: hypothetical protein DD432_09075, partial [Eubacterium sp.]|nr:hypothetical protein [Eubacterium sp.]